MDTEPALAAALLEELRAIRAGQEALASRLAAVEAGLQQGRAVALHGLANDRARWLEAIQAADGRHADPLSLTRHHAQVYSQNGEDGMVAEIFRRIGTRDRFFVEIGIENGLENNTRLLLEQGWRGIWIEGQQAAAEQAGRFFADYLRDGRLKIAVALVAPETIDAVLDQLQAPAEFDFLSLDIDQHTGHVWRGLRRRARAACIEYNASLPPSLAAEVPYDPQRSWDGSNWFGSGLKAMERIAAAKQMHLVGCDATGANAFFVDATETEGRFRAPFTAEHHYQPPGYALRSRIGHRPSPQGRRWEVVE